MIDPNVLSALNKQLNHEMRAAYNYFAMAGWFDARSLSGFAHWMLVQRTEELEHAMKLYTYILDRGGLLDFEAVEKPRADYQSVQEVFETALKTEQENTRAIDEVYIVAGERNDYATQSFLKWFLDEQVEEEKTVGEAVDLVHMAGDDKSALLVLNRQFGERTDEG